MLNNFCFHVYDQKSLIIGENGNDFFLTSSASPSPVTLEVIELAPINIRDLSAHPWHGCWVYTVTIFVQYPYYIVR